MTFPSTLVVLLFEAKHRAAKWALMKRHMPPISFASEGNPRCSTSFGPQTPKYHGNVMLFPEVTLGGEG